MAYRRFKPTFRKRKRWYFNAGANLPVIGKTNISFGSGKNKRSLSTKVKSIVRRQLEDPLHKLVLANQSMTHQTLYTLNLLGNITQGTSGYGNRISDNIHIDCVKGKFYFEQPSTLTSTSHIRCMLVWNDVDCLTGSDAWGSGLGSTDIFQSGTTLNGTVVGLNDPKKNTVIYDKTFTLDKQIGSTVKSKIVDYFIPINKTFLYKDGTNYGKFKNLYWVVLSFASGGSTGTTNTGFVNITNDVIFKDCK